MEGSQSQPEGSEGQLEGSWGLSERSEGQPWGSEGLPEGFVRPAREDKGTDEYVCMVRVFLHFTGVRLPKTQERQKMDHW